MRFLDRAQSRIPKPWRTVVDWLVTLALAAGFVLAFEAEVAKPYRIPSSSMEPTLHCSRPGAWCQGRFDDRVIANRLAYRFNDPGRGQIVVFEAPPAADRCESGDGGTTFVKRLIGLPGEQISERGGVVYVDGNPLREPYLDPANRDQRTDSWPTIPPGRYFFMGDNRVHSCDSRDWGTVPRDDLIGPVMLTYWPPNRVTAR
ncbi:signal peptidase I [Gaiella sp.]|jgi:signal peptidase I|uniref:signal peptidase I n=1 Tax=Gaiella sp. TaxID=2663207 RepID=UPI002E34C919|nr:signal peptidase I [Gaiella sp.]HEX5585153.1 signal peptidase I [Gaiella sp.]